MEWLIAHWDEIVMAITGVITVASVVVKLTPTTTDDVKLARFLEIMEKLSLNNTPVELAPKPRLPYVDK